MRTKVGLTKGEFSDDELQALWCHLDSDNSNQILPDEMAPFLKLAPTSTNAGLDATNKKAYLEAQAAAREAAAAPDKLDVSYAVPTAEMRAALVAEGVEPLDDAELKRLSGIFNEGLEAVRKRQNKDGFSWFSLFTEIDEDGSGFVTFDEWSRVCRATLELPPSRLSEHSLRGLWCHLDGDNNDQIVPSEMGAFLRLAPTASSAGFDATNRKAYLAAQAAAREAAAAPDQLDVSYAQPTAEMRAALVAGEV